MNVAVPRLEGIVLYKRSIDGRVCDPVTEFNGELRADVEAAKQIMFQMNGVGILAPQVGIFQRFSIANVGSENLVMVNPVFGVGVGVGGETDETGETERCLSIPGAQALVRRPRRIVVRFQDLDGQTHQREYADWEARIVLHEVDHLDGIFFLDRVSVLVKNIQLAKMYKTLKRGERNP